MLVAAHWDIKCDCSTLCFYFGCKWFKTYWWYILTGAFHYQHQITSGSWCLLCAPLVKYLYTVLWGLLWNFTPTFLLHMKWDGKHTFPIQTQKQLAATENCLKKPSNNSQTIFLLTLYGDNTRLLFCFQGSESTVWMPFIPHVSSLCCWLWGKGDGEMRGWKAILLANGLQSYQLRLSEA